ncbi:dihydroorotase [Clostridia bacterium]|nr:dihydroorotase [Clostridia bacterium]
MAFSCNNLVLKNAVTDEGVRDVYISGAIISGQIQTAQVIDATGLYVLPSFVDLHTHLRTPGFEHKENLESGCRAAIRGGYTAVNAMANTNPVCSDPSLAVKIAGNAEKLQLCDVYQCVSATWGFNGQSTDHLDALGNSRFDNAVRAVSDDGFGIADAEVFLEAMRKSMKYGKILMIHAEEEDFETLRDLKIIEKEHGRAHFCHVSTEVAARAIMEAKARGADVTWEVSPHHLALNNTTDFKVNPPLRPESDRRFLLECARAGLPDAIATDHAPHTEQDKKSGSPGLVGLESAFSVCNTLLSIENIKKLLCDGPRQILGLPQARVAAGYPADLVLLDLSKERKIEPSQFFSKGRNTPFVGMVTRGDVVYTIKGGVVKYEHGQIV